uniref:Microfibril associated protein 5 n=1 Tax=Equus asinus TaxID=9793 RepID=A0A8C4M8K5_EQUAS
CKFPSPFSFQPHCTPLAWLPLSLSLSPSLSLISLFQSRPNLKSFPGSGPVHLILQPKQEQREKERDTFSSQRTRWKEQRTIDNLVNDPSTDETASPNDKNATAECRDEKFACTRLYSVHRPVKQCVHQLCFTSLRRMYIINNEICSRLVCKEHEAMKDELCRQMAGLPPRRLRRSNYFRLPPCDNVNLQRPSGL